VQDTNERLDERVVDGRIVERVRVAQTRQHHRRAQEIDGPFAVGSLGKLPGDQGVAPTPGNRIGVACDPTSCGRAGEYDRARCAWAEGTCCSARWQAVHSRAVAPPLHLEIESDGQRIALPPGRASVIGRTAGADVLIPHVTVSRRHARFSDEVGVWTVEDAGSASGTWVNDAATGARRVQLGVGDRIRLGQVVLIVRGGA
jgi:hypothetical protein